jgi:hypothetical protein
MNQLNYARKNLNNEYEAAIISANQFQLQYVYELSQYVNNFEEQQQQQKNKANWARLNCRNFRFLFSLRSHTPVVRF